MPVGFQAWIRNKMGCSSSKSNKENAAPKQASKPIEKKEKKQLNKADYIFSKRTGEILIKEDKSIDGEQFVIEECKDCDIFLFDYIATISVDYCENCRLFIGPVESSAFIRNCTNCSIVMACQQFRSRDCKDVRLSLFSTTEPIIETSSDMQFACFDFFYFSLREQIAKAGLKVVNNKWWQIYDFTKDDAKPNWRLLPEDQVAGLLRTSQCTSLSPEELTMDRIIPVTLGSRPAPSQETCFVMFLPDQEALVDAFMSKASKTEGWTLCRTRSTAFARHLKS